MSHDLGEKLLLTVSCQIFRKLFNSGLNFSNESLNVLELLSCVVVKEASETIDPIVNDLGKLLDKRARVDS